MLLSILASQTMVNALKIDSTHQDENEMQWTL